MSDLAKRLRLVAEETTREATADFLLPGHAEVSVPLLYAAAAELDRLRALLAAVEADAVIRACKGGDHA